MDRGSPLSLHGPTPSSPFPPCPAAEDAFFPSSSKPRKGQGASAPRPHPPPRNCSGTRTHTHAGPGSMAIRSTPTGTLPTCASRNTSAQEPRSCVRDRPRPQLCPHGCDASRSTRSHPARGFPGVIRLSPEESGPPRDSGSATRPPALCLALPSKARGGRPTVPLSGDRSALTRESAARPAGRCSEPATSFPHREPWEPRREVAGRRRCRQRGSAAWPSPWFGAAGGGW